MNIKDLLHNSIIKAVAELFDTKIETTDFQATRKEFEGDITFVVFSLLRHVKGNPVQIGTQIGEYLVKNVDLVTNFNVVKGFLNISIDNSYHLDSFYKALADENFGFKQPENDDATMVEYSSPNTNKPLHLGHVRNNLLGYSVAEIIKAAGKKVIKTQIINDRGIHICKSMLAWERFGNGETPESSGLKGDKLVGNYYVKFDQEYKKEIARLIEKGIDKEDAKKQAPILLEAQQMLQKWESGDKEVVKLWKTMNQWVYDGFAITYKEMGVDFDALYYESQTYLLGKEFVSEGLKSDVFYKKEDGSVWCDLTSDGLDEKIVLRSDGTAVYMTQDIGTAIQRTKDYPNVNSMVYTVGNEQDYHFKVLFLILKKLGFEWAKNMFHLSYGMVELPEGKMKSREGTVVDADDLMQEMTNTAREISQELGKLEGYSNDEKENLYNIIGKGALKYFILKVDPKKQILFDPKESIDFNGNTGPFIQYTYARIQSILRKADFDYTNQVTITALHDKEKSVLKQLAEFPDAIQLAAKNYSPAIIANYTYDLVKEYNSFYQSVPILSCEDLDTKIFRTQLSQKVADTIKLAFSLLGIEVPSRM
jgi:arginyl-tRNA synthetase